MAHESESWLETQGVVIYSDIKYESGSNNSSSSNSHVHTPNVHYIYTVSNKEYQGDRVSFDNVQYGDISIVEEMIAPYPKGKTVSVYYDPDSPGDSTLEIGVQTSNIITPIISILVICFGIGFFIRSIIQIRKMKAA